MVNLLSGGLVSSQSDFRSGTRVPGLPPTAIVTKRVRPRGKLSAKVLDLSTKADR